jgi:PAS domain S-box-containing protein
MGFFTGLSSRYSRKSVYRCPGIGISHEQLVNLLRQRISPKLRWRSSLGRAKATFDGEEERPGRICLPAQQNSIFGKIDARILLDQENNRRYTVGGKTYILFSNIELQNFQKKPIAKILVALDISGELAGTRNFIIKVVLLALLLLLLACLVLYFSFGQLLTRIFNLNASLSRSNQNLTTAKAYVDNILASMNDGLLVTTTEGRISKANEALCRLLGYSEAELVEKNIASFFANPAEIEMNLARCGSEGCNISKAERRLLTKEGAGVPVLFSGTALAGETGSPVGIVCIVTDITDRKKSEIALREAHDLLEHRVIERTRELAEANTALTKEMAERKRAEAELQAQKMRPSAPWRHCPDFATSPRHPGYTQLAQRG